MGTRVLNTSSSSEYLRAYAHCGANGGVTLLLLNLGNSSVTINLSSSLSNYAVPRDEYHLTSPSLTISNIFLNGKFLDVDSSGNLPSLSGTHITQSTPIVIEERSYAFINLNNASPSVC